MSRSKRSLVPRARAGRRSSVTGEGNLESRRGAMILQAITRFMGRLSRGGSFVSTKALQRGLLRSPGRRGAVILEFAFVLPVLLMMILGAIEFGRAMMVANLLTSAARDGVRNGTLAIATNSDVTGAVESHLNAMSVPTDHATIRITVNEVVQDVSEAETGDRIGVQVSVGYSDVSWLPTPDFLAATQLRGVAVMRRE
jgi:hypothetical protein